MGTFLDRSSEYHCLFCGTEIYLPTSKAEENYVRNFIRGKRLRVATLEVYLRIPRFSLDLYHYKCPDQ